MGDLRDALILSAGLGTRLRPLTLVRAKPAIPVGGVPMIRRSVAALAAQGIDRVVVNVHYLPHTIARVLGDGSDLGARVRYSWEQPEVLGSGGGPRLAATLLDADPFVIVNGDTLTDVDVHALAAAHRASGALVTLALTANHDPSRYGGVALDGTGAVTGFVRKGAQTGTSYHFVGVQIASADAFVDLVPGRPASTIGGLYDDLIAQRPGSIRGSIVEASFWDVGTVGDYWGTSLAFAGGDSGSTWRGRRVSIAATAQLRQTIVWDDVDVAEGCSLDQCIVTDGVQVTEGSRYHRTILTAVGGDMVATPFDIP